MPCHPIGLSTIRPTVTAVSCLTSVFLAEGLIAKPLLQTDNQLVGAHAIHIREPKAFTMVLSNTESQCTRIKNSQEMAPSTKTSSQRGFASAICHPIYSMLLVVTSSSSQPGTACVCCGKSLEILVSSSCSRTHNHWQRSQVCSYRPSQRTSSVTTTPKPPERSSLGSGSQSVLIPTADWLLHIAPTAELEVW